MLNHNGFQFVALKDAPAESKLFQILLKISILAEGEDCGYFEGVSPLSFFFVAGNCKDWMGLNEIII